jgi:peptidoglycan-associated lipoprotein
VTKETDAMTKTRLLRLAACTAAAMILAACASTPLDEQPPASVTDKGAPATATTPGGATADPRAVASVDATGKPLDPLNDPASPLAKRSVFFDFDSFVVKPEFQGVVESHGKFLVANPARRVTIEGHADERGSREYNLALGQKRAEAVKARLRLLGVAEMQVESVSLGEEKPRATGHDEGAWAENRRADLNYR